MLDGDFPRAIARAAIHHEHLVGKGPHRIDDLADEAFLIFGGDDHGDTGVAHRLGQSGCRAVDDRTEYSDRFKIGSRSTPSMR